MFYIYDKLLVFRCSYVSVMWTSYVVFNREALFFLNSQSDGNEPENGADDDIDPAEAMEDFGLN